jgi:hypothetical protein
MEQFAVINNFRSSSGVVNYLTKEELIEQYSEGGSDAIVISGDEWHHARNFAIKLKKENNGDTSIYFPSLDLWMDEHCHGEIYPTLFEIEYVDDRKNKFFIKYKHKICGIEFYFIKSYSYSTITLTFYDMNDINDKELYTPVIFYKHKDNYLTVTLRWNTYYLAYDQYNHRFYLSENSTKIKVELLKRD